MYVCGYDCIQYVNSRQMYVYSFLERGRKDIPRALHLDKWNVYAPAGKLMRGTSPVESEISEL
jgi:hypothetical protein